MRVELINSGTELLMGFVINTHAAWLGQKLSGIGATLARQVCVNDTPRDILDALEAACQRADLVITTGGLGPTSDDITRNMVVEKLGLRTHVDARALEEIEARFRRSSRPMPESVKCQAVVPDDAIVLYNQNGTAPGLAIPVGRAPAAFLRGAPCRWLVMLPGPPRELHPMFENQVLPLLLREYHADLPAVDCRVFKVAGMGESLVEQAVEPVLQGIPGLEIGYCARSGEVDLRLVVRATDEATAHKLADAAEQKARQALGNAIFGTGDDTLEKIVVDLLRQQGRSVTTAESCTGGCLANRLTMVSGSSDVFRQGWVVYANEAKSEMLGVPSALIAGHGAVSEPVARAMAEGALRNAGADYALGITGIAGPTGGTTEKPVGTVFIALASTAATQIERHLYPHDRETFKFVTSQTALNLLRQELLRQRSARVLKPCERQGI